MTFRLLAPLLATAVAISCSSETQPGPSPTPPAAATVTSTPTLTTAPPAVTSIPTAVPTTGAITGRFGYPSDFIPPVTVYAISVADPNIFFSVDSAGFGNPPRPTLPPGVSQATYTMSGIAPGTYYVLAYRNDNNPGIGVYTLCTVKQQQSGTTPPGCTTSDQTLAPVTVRAGETVSRIDIVLWAFQQNGYPLRPR